MTERDPRQPVEFEPVAIRPRRARFDPLIVGVVVAVVGLTTAVLKPWDIGTEPATAERPIASAPAATAGVVVAPSAPPAPAVVAVAVPALAWEDIASVVRSRSAWGIRTIVQVPGGVASASGSWYDERWVPVDQAASERGTDLSVGDRSIMGLGLTVPDGMVPLDVRFWRRSEQGRLYWLDARPLARPPAEGGLIFRPPPTDPGAPAWGAGEYRIDALLGGGTIARFTVFIADRYENVRPSSVDPPFPTELVPPTEVDPSPVPVGPFATIDRRGWPLESVGGPPLDDAGAWLDTEPGTGKVPADRVAVAFLPRATGLGVRLPDGSVVRSAAISRLAPDPLANGPTPVGGGIIDRRDTDPWVVFAARRGDAWAPGVYRMDVTWADDAGLHEASWHVELRPGPYAGPPPLLAMARAWARHAGGSGVVVGRAEPLEGGPRSSAIRLLPVTDDGACGGTTVRGSPEGLGIAHPTDRAVRVTSMRVDGRPPQQLATDIATLQATDVVPGLTLIAPTRGATFEPGTYRLGIEDDSGLRVLTLCVGDWNAGSGT